MRDYEFTFDTEEEAHDFANYVAEEELWCKVTGKRVVVFSIYDFVARDLCDHLSNKK